MAHLSATFSTENWKPRFFSLSKKSKTVFDFFPIKFGRNEFLKSGRIHQIRENLELIYMRDILPQLHATSTVVTPPARFSDDFGHTRGPFQTASDHTHNAIASHGPPSRFQGSLSWLRGPTSWLQGPPSWLQGPPS